jgi:nanoRNase/pAp phosphatase (c-di-AMP/oligoRNAs hydrolase)|tara:strand:- start:10519 stop:11499 length:981 start_codon:yes stop_codon:yes gene_type:complete
MEQLAEFLKSYAGKKVVLLAHHNADPDAVGSAFVLSEALKKLGCETVIGVAESISKLSKKVVEVLGAEIAISPELDCDLLVLLDTSTPGQLSSYADTVLNSEIPRVIIDHHTIQSDSISADKKFVDEKAVSTTEIVFKLVPFLGFELNRKTALATAIGLITDTAHFRFANISTFELLTKLMTEHNIEPPELMNILSVIPDVSERIAVLKGMQRIKMARISDYLVATTIVGTFEAATARALLRSGADVSIAAARKDKEVRISMRSKKTFSDETCVDLGVDLAPELAKVIDGTGSGHPNAAGVNGKNTDNITMALEKAVEIIKQKVGK